MVIVVDEQTAYKVMESEGYRLLSHSHWQDFAVVEPSQAVILTLANYMEMDVESVKVGIEDFVSRESIDALHHECGEIPAKVVFTYRKFNHILLLIITCDGEILIYGSTDEYSENDIKIDPAENYYAG